MQVSYTKPAAGSNNKLKDAADNEVASFTGAVTNNSVQAPAPTGLTVSGTTATSVSLPGLHGAHGHIGHGEIAGATTLFHHLSGRGDGLAAAASLANSGLDGGEDHHVRAVPRRP